MHTLSCRPNWAADQHKVTLMDIFEAIAGRRSCRQYSQQDVDEPTIRRLIDAAVLAPNAVNEQPWIFTVVRDRPRLDRISQEAKLHMLASMPAKVTAGTRAQHFRSTLSDPAYQIFYHAPVLILISGREPGSWITEDCALAAENLMLMSHALGLGSCWIGFAQGYLNTTPGKRILELPAESVPVAPIIVGHPQVPTPFPGRKPPEVHWVG